MRRSRFSEEQIIGMLKEQEAGVKTADVCRRHGISEATFYIYLWMSLSLQVVLGAELSAYPWFQTSIRRRRFVARPNGNSAW